MTYKTFFALILFSFFLLPISSQIKLKTYANKIDSGYEFLADNGEYCPVSVKLTLKLNNMTSSNGNNKVFVIPARTKGYLITKLKVKKRGKYGYGSKTRYNYGSHLKKGYDKEYIYNLPFNKNKEFKVYQGYNGSFSHENENSLDFTMPIGTNINASREGIVVKVVEENSKNCGKRDCIKFNNLVLIYHVDGTFSEYVHIKKNGALVKVGDKIKKGQLIAKSGNVGFSTGPHLHFVVFRQKIGGRETLKTKFKINDGVKSVYLEEKEKYYRNY